MFGEDLKTSRKLSRPGTPETPVMEESDCPGVASRKRDEADGEDGGRTELQDAKTTYILARATPLSGIQRIFTFKPKLLFQLQELKSRTRPLPVIDVLASSLYAPKLSPAFTCVRERRKTRGGKEIMVLKSEDYNESDDICCDKTSREALAMVVERGRDCREAEIYLADGSSWKGIRLSNGAFEFVREDPNSSKIVIAMWRPAGKSGHDKDLARRSNTAGSIPHEQNYRFNVMHPRHRRQLMLASLTRSQLNIADHRSGASSFDNQCESFPSNFISLGDELPEGSRILCTTTKDDDSLKILIQVTGIWVALCLE